MNEDLKMVCRVLLVGLTGALLLICVSEGVRAAMSSHAESVPLVMAQAPSINGNCNVIGNGNSVCNGPQKLAFSDEIGNALLQRMPDKKPVNLTAVGSMADIQIGQQFAQFLQENGYQVTFNRVGMLIPPPDHKISIGIASDRYNIVIAPDAN